MMTYWEGVVPVEAVAVESFSFFFQTAKPNDPKTLGKTSRSWKCGGFSKGFTDSKITLFFFWKIVATRYY